MREFLCGVLFAGAAVLSGCGSIGEPLYPALNIPTKVNDLSAIERGDKIVIHFTIGPLTTEGMGLKQVGGIELRIGPGPATGFKVEEWAPDAKRIAIPARYGPGSVDVTAKAADFVGKQVLVAVRVGNAKGRMSQWSNIAIANIEPPLAAPTGVKTESMAEGVGITWKAPNENSFRLYRKESSEKEPALLGTPDKPEYLDTTAEFGKTYDYYVQGVHDKNESDTVGPVHITLIDKFPPKVPAGVVASVGINAIELAWERNTESDFKQYRVYRSEEGRPFVKIAEGLDAPAYSDKQVTPGRHYRYRITAVDQNDNESQPSDPIEAIAP